MNILSLSKGNVNRNHPCIFFVLCIMKIQKTTTIFGSRFVIKFAILVLDKFGF